MESLESDPFMKKLALPIRFERKTGRILDIGSGNNCLDIATHLVDLMPDRNTERGGDLDLGQVAHGGKLFRQGSVEAIPYEDGYFDFVHAAHVLEHVDSPARALSELQRVAAAGYIETPAAIMEQSGVLSEGATPGWDFHRWMVWTFPDQGMLYLKPKTTRSLGQFCGCPQGRSFQRIAARANIAEVDPFLAYHCKMTQFTWKSTIAYSIWDETQQGRPRADGSCDCQYSAFFEHFRVYLGTLRQWLRRHRFRKNLPDVYREMIGALRT